MSDLKYRFSNDPIGLSHKYNNPEFEEFEEKLRSLSNQRVDLLDRFAYTFLLHLREIGSSIEEWELVQEQTTGMDTVRFRWYFRRRPVLKRGSDV